MTDTNSFEYADRRIATLLDQLKEKQICGCCTARALLCHGAALLEDATGSAETIEVCESIITQLRVNNYPAPGRGSPLH